MGNEGRLGHGAAAALPCPQGCSFPWAVSQSRSEWHSPSHTHKPEQIPSNTTTGTLGVTPYTRARNKRKKTPGASILHSTWLLSARPHLQPRLCRHNMHPGARPAWERTWPAQKTVLKQPLWVANLPKTFNPHLFLAPTVSTYVLKSPVGEKRVGAQLPAHPARLWLPMGVTRSPWKKPCLVRGFQFPLHQIKPPEWGKEKSPNDHSS